MSLIFESVAAGLVAHAHVAFDLGVSIVLGKDGAALDEFVGLVEGELAPRRGQVLAFGAPPANVPGARRQVVTLRATEALPPAPSVRAALELVLAARAMTLASRELLSRWSLEGWSERRPGELSATELRALFLMLALEDERARVLALYEPLATVLPAERVKDELVRRASSAVVLATTTSLDDARGLGGTWYVIDSGTLDASTTDALRRGFPSRTLVVRSPEPRRLAALLAADSAVSAVEWDERRAPHELRLQGADAGALALALTRAALDNGIELELVAPLAPSLDELLAARAALLQKAYESAYQRAQAPVFAPPAYGASAEYKSPAAPSPNLSLPVPQPTPPTDNKEGA